MMGSVEATFSTVPLARPSPSVKVGCSVVIVIVSPASFVVVMVRAGNGAGLVVGGGTGGKSGLLC